MPEGVVELHHDVVRSPRVMQVEAMFDVPPTKRQAVQLRYRLPLEERDWQIGLIVGPSGAGKTQVARACFGDAVIESHDWPEDRSVMDAFPADMEGPEVTRLLSAVGFSSPPAWLRPFHKLSNGERFRVTVARALAEHPDLVVIDEFSSVVDRQVARVASATVAKAVRREPGRRFVAVSCHYDVEEWLQPDWTYEPAVDRFTWRSVQPRPRIELTIRAADRSEWALFRRHHYLDTSIRGGVRCYVAEADGRPVAFTCWGVLPHHTRRNLAMTHRLVVLPDWQGLGVGVALQNWVGLHLYGHGWEYRTTAAHRAILAAYERSPRWRRVGRQGLSKQRTRPQAKHTGYTANNLDTRRLNAWSYQYVPPAGTPIPERTTPFADVP